MEIKSPARLETAKAHQGRDTSAELKKAAAEFESLFIDQMLKEMRSTVMKSELFHGGNGEDMFMPLFDAELSKVMAGRGGIGLQDILLKEFSGKAGLPVEPLPSGPQGVNGLNQGPEAAAEPRIKEPVRLPVNGRVSSSYGLRPDPFTGETRFHHGMDIAASEGTPIYPAAGGKVVFSGERGGYGNVVEVLHKDGTITRYGHNMKNLVAVGDTVTADRPIAYVGSTGRSTGAHLHFEVIGGGKSLDPHAFLKG